MIKFKYFISVIISLLITGISLIFAQDIPRNTNIHYVHSITGLNNTLASIKTGDHIIIQNGTYTLMNNIIISNKQSITIMGKGTVHIQIKRPLPSGISIINSNNIIIKNISLLFSAKLSKYSTIDGIYLENVKKIIIKSCYIAGFTVGIYSLDSQSVTVKATSLRKNKQWALYGNYKDLRLIENDIEYNGGLFFINGKNIHSLGNILPDIFMKDNWANNNKNGINGFMPIPFPPQKETMVPSPFSQEQETNKKLEEGITGSSLQEDLDREFEMENKDYTDQYLENSDLY